MAGARPASWSRQRRHRRRPALVLASADWHGGVIGIVAGRLAEQYGRPAPDASPASAAATVAGEDATRNRCGRLGRPGPAGRCRLRAARGAAGVRRPAGRPRRPRGGGRLPVCAETRSRPSASASAHAVGHFPDGPAGRRAGARRRVAAQRPDARPAARPGPLEPYGARTAGRCSWRAGWKSWAAAKDRPRRAAPELPRPPGRARR